MTATHLERRKESTQIRITQLVSGKSIQACQEHYAVLPLECYHFLIWKITQKGKQLTCRVVVRFIWNNACEGILSIIQTIKKEGRWIDIESCDSPRKCIRVGKQKWKAGRLGPNQGSLLIHFVWLALYLLFFQSTFKTRRFRVQNQISSISFKHVRSAVTGSIICGALLPGAE